MTRRWWLCGAVILAMSSALVARQGVVRTQDGQTIEGDVNETATADSVSVTIHGTQVLLPRSDIASIDYGGDLQEFDKRFAGLAPTDVRGRLELGRWALERNLYEAARRAAEDVRRIEPDNAEAALLLKTIQSQQVLQSRQAAATRRAATAVVTGITPVSAPTTAASPPRYLSDEDVNLIRQAELRPEDNLPIQFVGDVRQRYLLAVDGDRGDFLSASPVDQAIQIIQSGDAHFMRDVRIEGDPRPLAQFQARIEKRILVGCATSGCHGGNSGAGGLFLYSDTPKTAAWYTNFYILQMYKTQINAPPSVWGQGPTWRTMLDRIHPTQSLLVQFGLPASLAATPHLQVPRWRPIFSSQSDPAYLEMVQWITSLKPVEPDYGIEFELPKPSASGGQSPGAATH